MANEDNRIIVRVENRSYNGIDCKTGSFRLEKLITLHDVIVHIVRVDPQNEIFAAKINVA